MDEVLHEVSELEIAGTYNSNVLLDDIVRMSVKALGFAPNRNNFMFKRKPLEKLHQTKFGKVIPAFKSSTAEPMTSGSVARMVLYSRTATPPQARCFQ